MRKLLVEKEKGLKNLITVEKILRDREKSDCKRWIKNKKHQIEGMKKIFNMKMSEKEEFDEEGPSTSKAALDRAGRGRLLRIESSDSESEASRVQVEVIIEFAFKSIYY